MDSWRLGCVNLWTAKHSDQVQLSTIEKQFLDCINRYASEGLTSTSGHSDLNNVRAISSLEEFDQWYEHVEEVCESEDDVRMGRLEDNLGQCTDALAKINGLLDNLDDLKSLYERCSNKTNSLHDACESILQQQHALIIAVETINEKIAYFSELEAMNKKLGNPTPLILTESLVPTLTRLDECIAFMESKPQYKDSQSYLQEYLRLQAQTLSTVANHVQNTIQQTAKQVIPDTGDSLAPSDSVFTLFYGKFQSNSHRIKSLMTLIEDRIERDERYYALAIACQNSYFDVREKLIGPVLSVAIEDMVSSHQRNYCSLLRNSTRMLMHICRDEYQLFFQFFSKGDDVFIKDRLLSAFLEGLCSRLYNVLRPIVIHINHFETLSELCLVIKNEVLNEFVANHAEELHSFGTVMEQLLQDCQERLVYKSNLYVQENIAGYNAAPGDLAYPEKLEMMENIAECLNASTAQNMSRSASVASIALSDISLVSDRNWDVRVGPYNASPADIHGMWYPTVRRTILCLTKLYRSLDKSAFQGLSQDVVAACLVSLEDATVQIAKRKTPIDAQLFLIKHLLIVREQIAPFHIECTFREVNLDFNRVKTAALDLIQKRDNLFTLNTNNGLLRFLFEVPGATSVVEQVFDPQKIVDARIKVTCEQFIGSASEHLVSTLIRFNNMARTIDKVKGQLRAQTFATPENLKGVIKQAIEQLKANLPTLRRSMSIYLANHDTETILFRPIKAALVKHYDELIKLVAINYTADEKAAIDCPSKEDIEILLSL